MTCTGEHYEQWKYQTHTQGFLCGLKRSLLGSAVSNEGRVEAVSEVVKKTSTSLGASPPFSAEFLPACRLSSTLFTRQNRERTRYGESKTTFKINRDVKFEEKLTLSS